MALSPKAASATTEEFPKTAGAIFTGSGFRVPKAGWY
jgi:hypothetical protein